MRNPGYSLLDIHFSDFLAVRSGLGGDDLETFRNLVRELSKALADGHSCLPIRPEDRETLAASPLVSEDKTTPLVLFGDCLYLHRYFSYEGRLAAGIRELAERQCSVPEVEALLDASFGPDGEEIDGQKLAARLCVERSLAIISGGPGTGKTTTVVKIIGVLLQAFGCDLQVALAAPTGKAAMRLSRAVGKSKQNLPFAAEVKVAIPDEARTLHRLLGARERSVSFRHNRENPLPWDVVVVDEASMVDLAMMSKLVQALKPCSRLILLGDKDQLVSVESGAVLADLVEALPENTVRLQKTYRFDAAIARLSGAVNSGEVKAARHLLAASESGRTRFLTEPLREFAGNRYLEYMRLVEKVDDVGYERVFAVFNGFRILCALRLGTAGVAGINAMMEQFLYRKGYDCLAKTWYPGRPVLITRNDYSLDLYNGDVGIALPGPADDVLRVVFPRPDGTFKTCLPYRLPPCETAYAMTIHKSQGSEFDDVLVVLPERGENPILSRELVYTAVTRARRQVLVSAEDEIFRQALECKIRRYSNLKDRLLAG
jgi:exodeoxyribonuclease V alpha subunit